MKRLVLVAATVVAMSPVHAQVSDPVMVTGVTRTISDGPGAQTDPHVSGSRVSHTNRTVTGSRIDVFDLTSGVTTAIPEGINLDSISDISGNIVVFTRRETSTSTQRIVFADVTDPTLAVTGLAPDATTRRTGARVGGDTVAFQQFTTGSNSVSAICVASIAHASDPATCLTDETASNSDPDVSPDGNVVVFQHCVSPDTGCDVYAARRNTDGSWPAPVAITTGAANDLSPTTNGTVVAYSSNVAGDFDVYYAPVAGTGPTTRVAFDEMAGTIDLNPQISGTLISMERVRPGETNADLYLFDIATNTAYRATATADVDERLNGVALNPDGTVHVVWAAVDPLNSADGDNVYALSFNIARASYDVCRLFDASRSFKAGRVAPLKIRLCDGSGANRSDPSLVLTATGLVQLDGSASSVLEPDSPGQANPDGLFRYDAALGGYVFNLSTAGLTTGTWELQFRVSGDSAVYGIRFDVK